MTATAKKLHWTQTEEGKARMSELQKLAWKKTRGVKKRAYKRSVQVRKKMTVTIEGPDAAKALAELLSNAQYDKLNVSIRVEKN